MMTWRVLSSGTLVVTALGVGCASRDAGNDGETHFLCKRDPDCPADEACVDGECVAPEPPRALDSGPSGIDSPLADLLEGRHDYYLPDPVNAMNLRLENGTFHFNVDMCDAFDNAYGSAAMTPDGTLRLTSPDGLAWPVSVEVINYVRQSVDAVRITAATDTGIRIAVSGTVQDWIAGGNCMDCGDTWQTRPCADAFANDEPPPDAGPAPGSSPDAGSPPGAGPLFGPLPDGAQCPRGKAPLEIVATSFSGQYLALDVSYLGGCAEHTFDVWWSQVVYTTLPPLVPLQIHHYDAGDTCTDVVNERFYVDMSALDSVYDSMWVELIGAWQNEGTLTPALRYEPPATPVPPPTAAPVVGIEIECGGIFP